MNDKIGRCGAGGGSAHLNSLQRVRGWCEEQGVLFKVLILDMIVVMVVVVVLIMLVVMVVVVPSAPDVSVGGQGQYGSLYCVDC